MIPLNDKTKQDFLTPEQIHELCELGVNTKDAKYCILKSKFSDDLYVEYCGPNKCWQAHVVSPEHYKEVCCTYTLAELLYKLPEWISKDGHGPLCFMKDAPFYSFYYKTKTGKEVSEFACPEYPIVAAFETLKWCIKKGYGYSHDISDK